MRIAIQGELGSFSHQAALQMEPQATIVPCAFSAEVFKLVESAEVCAAVIPIENSLAGSVVEHFDLLFQSDVQIERESLLRIRHNLIGVPGSSDRGYPPGPVPSRCAGPMPSLFRPASGHDAHRLLRHRRQRQARNRPGRQKTGAIASEQAALAYGGEVLAAGIEDNPANYTRFFLIRSSAQVRPLPDPDKVSIAFTVENRPGTLVSALQVFAEHNTNLCKVESRPVHGQPWQYVFYVDYQVVRPGGNQCSARATSPPVPGG